MRQKKEEEKDLSAALLPVDPSAAVQTEPLPSMRAFLVVGSSGQYDEHCEWVIAVYLDQPSAERAKESWIALQRRWRSKYEAIEIPDPDDDSDWYERREAIRKSAPENIDPSDDVYFDVKPTLLYQTVSGNQATNAERSEGTRRSEAQENK